jgi:hypothetical protein
MRQRYRIFYFANLSCVYPCGFDVTTFGRKCGLNKAVPVSVFSVCLYDAECENQVMQPSAQMRRMSQLPVPYRFISDTVSVSVPGPWDFGTGSGS